jgi:hypothetical protein
MVLRAYLIFDHIVYNSIDDAKLYKIELGHGGAEALKINALRPAKRIKELFRIPVKTGLVSDMDSKGPSGRSQVISQVVILCVVCDKPLKVPKRDSLRLGREDILELGGILWLVIEPGE